MKSPFIKLALAAVVLAACLLGFTLWNHTQNIALADVLAQIEQVQAYLYQMSMTVTSSSDLPPGKPHTLDIQATVLTAPDYGMKMTLDTSVDPNQPHRMIQQQYIQPQHKRILMLMPKQKEYMEMELNDQLLEKYRQQSNDPCMMVARILRCDYQKLGKSRIDGIEVQGFQTTDPAYGGGLGDVNITVWVGTQTRLPVQVDMDMTIKGDHTMHMQGTLRDFQWDIPVSASEFEPNIPADYNSVAGGPIKMPQMNEENMIKGLKLFREYFDRYSEDMGMMSVISKMSKIKDVNTPAAQAFEQSMKNLDQKEKTKAMIDLMMPIQAAVGFYAQLVREHKDPAYYGDRVTPDMPKQLLLRWRIADDQYRVIFGDLSKGTATRQELADLEAVLPQVKTKTP